MSLRERMGPMIKAAFCLIGFYAVSFIISFFWNSIYLSMVNNKFFKLNKNGNQIKIYVSVTCSTAAFILLLFCFISLFMYYFGNRTYFHLMAILAMTILTIVHIVFLIMVLYHTTPNYKNSMKLDFIDYIKDHINESQIVQKWVSDQKCGNDKNETCSDELDNFLLLRMSVGFIATIISTSLVLFPIVAAIILVCLMACVRPEANSDFEDDVPSDFVHSIIVDSKDFLSGGLTVRIPLTADF